MMISIRDLQKVNGQQTVLDIPIFNMNAGQIIAITGPVGSGKEILFDLLLGKIYPSAGSIRVAGIDPTDHRSFSHHVGVLFSEDALYKRMSLLENLLLHCQFYGIPKSRALEVLALIGLSDQVNYQVEKLPSGLQRRLAFGRAILHRPQTLLLYEPFIRCDERSIGLLRGLITFMAESGAAVLILADRSMHLTGLSDTVYSFDQGRLVEIAAGPETPPATAPFKIPVKLEDRVVLVNPVDIFFAEAEGGHTCLHTVDGLLRTQFTVTELEERLSRSGFFRAHRAYLVNLQHIKEVIPFTRNSYSIRLDIPEKTLIPLSKSAAGELRDLLRY
jgi:ABC-2 type transport system ATP-binding protein